MFALHRGYGNEQYVGEGIRDSGVPRSEIFITSKLWGTWHSRVEECLDQTLANLGTDYLDLYLVHWPIPLNPGGNHPIFHTLPDGTRDIDHSWKLSDTWKQMEGVLKKGKVKAIGVSNFSKAKLEEILPTAEIVPAVNQLELHVYNPQHELVKYLKSKDIVPEAYSPLGSTNSPLLTDETVLKIAQKHSLSAPDVLIGYLAKWPHIIVSKGFVVIPKSVTPSRIASNLNGSLAAVNNLEAADITELDGLAAAGKQKRLAAVFIIFGKGAFADLSLHAALDLGFDNWPPYK
ncbi:hypothetical protein C0995_009470 [Termitomyces sp. Mi166|nr:hypothetical protein C0995_009470 [Termitomyces sp. Mi166\